MNYPWQATVQDDAGNVIVNPVVTVWEDDGVTLAAIFDEAGAQLPNPYQGGLDGFVQFWAESGAYMIEGAKAGEETDVWHWVAGAIDVGQFTAVGASAVEIGVETLEIRTVGYYAAGDGGGAVYVRASGEPLHTGKIQTADGSWWELSVAQDIFAEMFGAAPNVYSSQNDAIDAALGYVKAKGGMTLNFGDGVFHIDRSVTADSNNIKLIGRGAGDFHYVAPYSDYRTAFKWIGPTGMTMVRFVPTDNNGMWLSGAGFDGIFLDASGVAATSMVVRSSFGGKYSVVSKDYTTAAFNLGVDGAVVETKDSMHNDIWVRGSSLTGSLLIVSGLSDANSCFNRINVDGNYKDGHGIQVFNADNNIFEHVRMYRESGGTGVGVVLNGGAFNEEARGNIFIDLSPGAGGLHSTGTDDVASPAKENQCLFYDSPNFAPDPTYGTGASFWYSRNDNKQPHVRARVGDVTINSATQVQLPIQSVYEDDLGMRSGNTFNIKKPGVYRVDYTIHHNSSIASGDKYILTIHGPSSGQYKNVIGFGSSFEGSVSGSFSSFFPMSSSLYVTIERASGSGSFVTGSDVSLSSLSIDYISRSL